LASLPAAIGTTFQVAIALCIEDTLIYRFTWDSSEIQRNVWASSRLCCQNTNITNVTQDLDIANASRIRSSG